MNTSWSYLFKIVLLGDPAVGKTSLYTRHVDCSFSSDYKATTGATFSAKSKSTEHGIVKYQIWDLASGSRFQVLLPMYVRGAHAAILIHDLTRTSTLFNIPRYIEMMKNHCKDAPLYLVGNKLDLVVQNDDEAIRTVYYEDIETTTEFISNLQREGQLKKVLFTSAKTGDGVEELFDKMVDDLVAIASRKGG